MVPVIQVDTNLIGVVLDNYNDSVGCYLPNEGSDPVDVKLSGLLIAQGVNDIIPAALFLDARGKRGINFRRAYWLALPHRAVSRVDARFELVGWDDKPGHCDDPFFPGAAWMGSSAERYHHLPKADFCQSY